MLTELRITNFALIDQLSLEFDTGFHVLTGETGAGKSVLVDALALLVGGRASADQIRTHADEAELEAAFTVPEHGPLPARLREAGFLKEDESELIVRRVLARNGRNRAYLNGRLAPLHLVEQLAGTLVDIHGQHDQQSLLSPDSQRDALDAFGEARQLRADYRRHYEQWRANQRLLDEAVRDAEDGKRQEEFVRFQCHELEEADLLPGEEEALTVEHQRLAQSHRLEEAGEGAYDTLYGGERSVLAALGAVESRLEDLRTLDPRTTEWSGLCDSATVQLRELAHHLRDYLQRLEQDPQRLARVEDRLDLIRRLKRKYGSNYDELRAQAEALKARLSGVEDAHSIIEKLRESVVQEAGKVETLADKLSELRATAAVQLQSRVEKELAALRMPDTHIEVRVQRSPGEAGLTSNGRDDVEYLISANPGEPPRPLAKVASGGELSRVMLALKTVLAKNDRVPVLVFDEVDAGVGGAVAEVMGRRLRALGVYHQVFSITHLPQVASQADHHWLVEKTVKQKRTEIRVQRLDRGGRQNEVARMVAGETITKAVRETAAEMMGKNGGRK